MSSWENVGIAALRAMGIAQPVPTKNTNTLMMKKNVFFVDIQAMEVALIAPQENTNMVLVPTNVFGVAVQALDIVLIVLTKSMKSEYFTGGSR